MLDALRMLDASRRKIHGSKPRGGTALGHGQSGKEPIRPQKVWLILARVVTIHWAMCFLHCWADAGWESELAGVWISLTENT